MTNRITMYFDLDLGREEIRVWLSDLAKAMDSSPNIIEPVVNSHVLDVQEIANPAHIRLTDVLGGGLEPEQEIRGPFISTVDPFTGQEYVQPPGEHTGEPPPDQVVEAPKELPSGEES